MARDKEAQRAFEVARERYEAWGVDVEAALERAEACPLSIHCWQGDDVSGFERPDAALSGGGLKVTGNRPGRARTPEELRADLEAALALVPGPCRVNLHAMYGEFHGKAVDRDAIGPEHFEGWMDWAAAQGLALDFNATCFSHGKAADGFTLSHPDPGVRAFWIAHVRRSRAVAAEMGRRQKSPCLHNLWIPDGMKDLPADRWAYRERLAESLDRIFEEDHPGAYMKDALESKLFGIGTEAYTVGSHEFYLAYALTRGKMVCLDLGHFHPTESVADKLSAILRFQDELLLHVSRGVRWDSDHVVILDDPLLALACEIAAAPREKTIHLALDFFDASMNRVGAWALGARSVRKALLFAFLAPWERIRAAESEGDFFVRLAVMEEAKHLPFGAVWEHLCRTRNVPAAAEWIEAARAYEARAARARR